MKKDTRPPPQPNIPLHFPVKGDQISRQQNELLLLQQKYEQKTEETILEKSKELEEFVSVASHDLKSPLQTISNYLQILQLKYRGQLDKEAEDLISNTVGAAKRLSQLIDNLLQYSLVCNSAEPKVLIDADEIISTVKNTLQRQIDESGTEIICSHLPKIMGERSLLLLLFQNLIGNAIFFRSDKTPIIEISAECQKKYWHFSVKDNGIGIDPKYKEDVFKPFRTLEGSRRGSGIGLAICRKIVERHHGKISVESLPGVGSSFHFSIPIVPC